MRKRYELKKIGNNDNKIIEVKQGSIAENVGIKAGYKLAKINDSYILDILDYKYLTCDDYLYIECLDENDNYVEFEVEKNFDDDLGLVFENELIDKPIRCQNKCIFCFMNQLPKIVRKTLVFKDDDYRLSFLTGNYITLTNLKESDVDRIIDLGIANVNISIHATDEKVRCMMLGNKRAGEVLKYLKKFHRANVSMNFQIVLCKDINDKEILSKSIKDLSKYIKTANTLSIVPVGLTNHRNNLYNLKPLTKDDCVYLINQVSKFQKKFKEKYKKTFVYLADEIYIKAEMKIPCYSHYENFAQIENGVGMIADFRYEFNKEMKYFKLNKFKNLDKEITIITGKVAEKFMKSIANRINIVLGRKVVNVLAIENTYYGENITVTGLLTGTDINKNIDKFKGYTFLPNICLKEDADVFLDDVKLSDIKYDKLIVTDNSAKGLLDKVKEVLNKGV